MKLKITFLVTFTIACLNVFGQTVPFGYNMHKGIATPAMKNAIPPPKNSSETKNPDKKDSSSKKDVNPKPPSSTNIDSLDFISFAQALESRAVALELATTTAYNSGIAPLKDSNENPPIDQNAVEPTRLAQVTARDAGFAKAKSLRKLAKGYRYLARTNENFNIFPVWNAVDAEMYYNGTLSDSKAKFLNNSLLSFSTDGSKASIYNELYADYFGPIRIGFGALISNNQTANTTAGTPDTTASKQDAVQRLLGGGGTASFNFSYPIINAQTADNALFFKLIASPKVGIDIPKIGTDNSSYAVNYNLGVEGSIFYTGDQNLLTFYSNFRFSKIYGNGLFYDNLSKKDHGAFGFNQLSFGFAITSRFRLSYNYYFGSNFVKTNFPSTVSFTVIPQ